MTQAAEPSDLLARVAAGDEAAFTALAAPQQRSIFRHCYRMLGSGADAEDAVQDTLERAWRRIGTYDGSGAFAAWLHRIATNVCLDMLRARKARGDPAGYGPPARPGAPLAPPEPELAWVEPVSDNELTGPVSPQDEVILREEISLAFVAALQRLAPRQRAALLLHDVLGFSHAEVGETLAISTSAVNSLLSRARERVGTAAVRAWRLADIDAFVELIAEDIRFSMPPLAAWFEGRVAAATFIETAVFAAARPHGVQLRPGSCNGQPAFADYQPDEHGRLAVSGLQILQLGEVHGQILIAALVSYRDPALAVRCGLPEILG